MTGYKAIFFDLDGTILTPEFTVPNEVLPCLESLKDKGFRVSIATGRSFENAAPFLEELSIKESAVFSNGAMFYDRDTEQLTLNDFIKKHDVQNLLPVLAKLNISFKLQTLAGHIYCDDPVKWGSNNFPNEKLFDSNDSSMVADVLKIILLCSPEKELVLRKSLTSENDFLLKNHIFRTGSQSSEIAPIEINKSIAIKKILKKWNISPQQTIGVGDQQNDYEMIRDMGFGVSVSNGFAGNHQISSLQIPPPEKGGIKFLTDHILKNLV
ncbi:MAG: HAD family phosphatase [SAR324 cluster bacterium]|nr:HAD family phosphatase [SAR324 cluster bacterium]